MTILRPLCPVAGEENYNIMVVNQIESRVAGVQCDHLTKGRR